MNEFYKDIKSFLDYADNKNLSTQEVRIKLLEFASLLGNDVNPSEDTKLDATISSIYDILYDPKKATIFPESMKNDQKFEYIYNTLKNFREAIPAFSKGDLSVNFKSKGYVSGALKMLQSNLKHLTWQAQMVAQGDFTQKVDFMGDFSDAFNQMILQLDNNVSTLKSHAIELTNLNITKDKFFAIISHDLRGPIGSLKLVLEMMVTEFDSFSKDDSIKFLSILKDSAVNIFNLLENLFIWSMSERGLDDICISNLNLHNIVNDISLVLKLGIDAKSIELTSKIEPDTFVSADLNHLTIILRNLISNAVKFTPNGGKVEVGAIIKPSAELNIPDDFYKIYVKDNGVGIDEKIKNKLFRIDTSVTNLGTDGEKGTGLGLVLCKEFVEKNGGSIWVESEKEFGSTFYFTIPKVKESYIN